MKVCLPVYLLLFLDDVEIEVCVSASPQSSVEVNKIEMCTPMYLLLLVEVLEIKGCRAVLLLLCVCLSDQGVYSRVAFVVCVSLRSRCVFLFLPSHTWRSLRSSCELQYSICCLCVFEIMVCAPVSPKSYVEVFEIKVCVAVASFLCMSWRSKCVLLFLLFPHKSLRSRCGWPCLFFVCEPPPSGSMTSENFIRTGLLDHECHQDRFVRVCTHKLLGWGAYVCSCVCAMRGHLRVGLQLFCTVSSCLRLQKCVVLLYWKRPHLMVVE